VSLSTSLKCASHQTPSTGVFARQHPFWYPIVRLISWAQTRALVAVWSVIAVGLWTPVLCCAAGHVAFETIYSCCCGSVETADSRSQPLPLLRSQDSSGWRDCTDTPLISLCVPESPHNEASLDVPPALTPAPVSLTLHLSTISTWDGEECVRPLSLEPCYTLLRC
jgi:hypothetical protein